MSLYDLLYCTRQSKKTKQKKTRVTEASRGATMRYCSDTQELVEPTGYTLLTQGDTVLTLG